MHSKTKGDISQACLLAALLKKEFNVLIPYGDNTRYDFVIEKEGKFYRVQCKTARVKNDSVVFNACSVNVYKGGIRENYKGQIEYFGTYCPVTDKCYLIPIEDCGVTEVHLRLVPAKRSKPGMKYAKDYEI